MKNKIIAKGNNNKFKWVKKIPIKVERLQKLTRHWSSTPEIPTVKILGRIVKNPTRSVMNYVSDIYGLSRGHSIPFCVNLGYKPFVKSNLVTPTNWLKIKGLIERNEILEKRLRKFEHLSLRNKVKQGNFQGKKFWRGLPIHGQNARTNGNSARRLNIAKLPDNMRIDLNNPFLMVSKIPSRVLSKKLLLPKQGVSEKGQFARKFKKKR